MPSPVSHPPHYNSHPSGIECIEIVEHMSFNLGNAVKYIWRAGLKTDNPVEDLEKARFYIEREIQRLSKQNSSPMPMEERDDEQGTTDQRKEIPPEIELSSNTRNSMVPLPRQGDYPEGHEPMPDLPEARCSCGAAHPPKIVSPHHYPTGTADARAWRVNQAREKKLEKI